MHKEEVRRQAGYADMLKGVSVKTWPPYCFTELCPDRRYRLGGKLYGELVRRRR